MMNDEHGCTIARNAGEERYEYFTGSSRPRRRLCQYDYRHTDGTLFSCVKPTLEECRIARDAWIIKKQVEA